MDVRESPLESHRHSSPSFCGGIATQSIKKPPPLRIVVPPSEYCPFSTDLTLPSTPPVPSSCFTFSDRQDLVHQSISAPPTLTPVLQVTAVADLASPTSSQFLLMPPTPYLENADNEAAICVSPLMFGATNGLMYSGSPGTKFENLREISSSTWLSELGGHTETDRIFRRNQLGIGAFDAESSLASTPALSPSALSPSSQVSSSLAYNLPASLTRTPASLPPASLLDPCTMSSRACSLTRLVLKPTGTDTFPSALDSLQAWCESITPGLSQSEEPHSPLSEGIHDSRSLEEPVPEPLNYPSHQLHSRPFSPISRASRSRTLIKHAKMFGGRVKRLVTLRSTKHHGSMDRGVNFRVVTSQDSEHGSVILITAPPPPCDSHPPIRISHGPSGQDHRSISEYSSVVQTSERGTIGMTGSGTGQGGSKRNALRRLSFAALSTIKRF